MLLAGLFFGMVGSIQYVFPEFLKSNLSFEKVRPLHVTLVLSWIMAAAIGSVYYFFPGEFTRRPFSNLLGLFHFGLFIVGTISIVISYLNGIFGGREYLEYPPILAIIIGTAWVVFAINFFRTVSFRPSKWPVYIWMWSTGVFFFVFTYLESYLWLSPFFRDNIVRDITVQWKSLGAMVGAWNMLIYGTAFYMMESIGGNREIARSRKTFFLYFLGLTNLMFNWGHHTYIVPAVPFIRNVSYIISMTELLILGNIILGWRNTLKDALKNLYFFPYRFILMSDVWIFLNLVLAILISIPFINLFTHGTHITVAHSMGATIGINSAILLASVFFIISMEKGWVRNSKGKFLSAAFVLFNISLVLFWLSLLAAGYYKSIKISPGSGNFIPVMSDLKQVFEVFVFAGFLLLMSLGYISIIALRYQYSILRNSKERR